MNINKISIVIPSYNEESNIKKVYEEISLSIGNNYTFEVIFVDDGSSDLTLEKIKELQKQYKNVFYVSFSRNFGHQNSLIAGLDYADGDCIITMDADLQHPPSFINEMVEKWKEGYDIVYTKREKDKNLPFFKKITSRIFYKIINWLSDIKLEDGAADFRLIDKKVADIIRQNPEYNLFIRGYIAWMGFKQYCIAYTPGQRFSGSTKYSLNKMFAFATNGITSFSIKPLRLGIVLGSIVAFIAILYLIYVIYIALFTTRAISGWASVLASVLLLGSINLMCIGIVGEYLGKLFLQTKGRPQYIIRDLDDELKERKL